MNGFYKIVWYCVSCLLTWWSFPEERWNQTIKRKDTRETKPKILSFPDQSSCPWHRVSHVSPAIICRKTLLSWVMSGGGNNLPFRGGSPEQIHPVVRSLRAAAHNKVEMSILRDETMKYCHEFFMWSNISKVSLKRKLVLRAEIPEQYIPKRYLCYSEIVLYFTSHWQILMAIFSNGRKTFFRIKSKPKICQNSKTVLDQWQ